MYNLAFFIFQIESAEPNIITLDTGKEKGGKEEKKEGKGKEEKERKEEEGEEKMSSADFNSFETIHNPDADIKVLLIIN